jgi:hypothetical protein
MSSTDKSTTTTPTTTVPEWDELPCVQYGFPEDKGPIRAPKLQTIFEQTPDNATTASPVYILTRDQYDRQQRLDRGYEVTGDYTSIATELQDECEADDRVLYPIHIESDVYHREDPATLIEWFREFVENYLCVPFRTCRLYFSGNRSIHVHVPRFVSAECARERLKKLAETFCTEKGAELDCGLYYAKRLFRLPGVEHSKTGLPKVEIEPEWEHARIIREASTSTASVPESYETVLRRVFLQSSLMEDSAQFDDYTPSDLFRVLNGDRTVLDFEADKQDIETPLIEQEECPDDPSDSVNWLQYNAKEFSPYALAGGNGRSVAVVKVKGAPFARKDVTIGNSSHPVHALIPAYFYGAQGCAGEEFTKAEEHAPLQLSARDFEKWDYREGENVVIIGGQSRNSRIFLVESWQATVAGHALTGDGASRQAALDYLENEGYDVGKAGTGGKAKSSNETGSRRQHDCVPTVRNPRTEAAALQQQAEQDGIETLTHLERGRTACRLLKWGWEPAWEWFRKQYGTDFDPNVTRKQFRSVIETFPEDYGHVKVPQQS